MRALNEEEQDQRKRKVLQYVIHEYIRTSKPVGSQSIATASRLGLSSATIRNVLSELEKEDMITHPHTSAGRVPTDKGYRYYVDSIIELQRLAGQEKSRIHHEYELRIREIEELMTRTSRMLSTMSRFTGFVTSPKLEQNVFSCLELIPIPDRRILVAMVTTSGMAKHFVIPVAADIPREKLLSISRVINDNFQGCTLQEVKLQMVEKLEQVQDGNRDIFGLAKEIGEEIKKIPTSEIYLDGASNILSLPDFTRTEEIHDLFKMMEQKHILTNLLEQELSDPASGTLEGLDAGGKKSKRDSKGSPKSGKSRIQVRIGSENPIKALQNLSVVSSTYQLGENSVGVLGILGPKRMEYAKMIALVDYVSQMVNQLMKGFDKR